MEKKILHVGRAPDNDIVVEEASVSKKHIQLSYEEGIFYVRDVGSSNGTFINENRIPLYELMPLQMEDVLKLAHIEFPWQQYFEHILKDQDSQQAEGEVQPSLSNQESSQSIIAEVEHHPPSPQKSLKESIIRHKKKVNRIQDFAFYALLGLTLVALVLWYFTNVTKP